MNKLNKENVIHFIHFHTRFSSKEVAGQQPQKDLVHNNFR